MKNYALIGYPLSHSFSPILHGLVYKSWELPNIYLSWEVLPEELELAIPMLKRNLAGFNVTAPHKKAIIRLLDDLDFSAQLYGAVNTVKSEEGKLIGFNTDGAGFLKGLSEVDYELTNKHILLLGAGGASQTIALELAHQGCPVTIANRELSEAYALKLLLEKRFPEASVEIAQLNDIPKGSYSCIINATPVGMGSLANESPISSDYFRGVELAYDLIYNPAETLFLKEAGKMGCLTVNGLTMLIAQGLKAIEIWFEREIDTELEENIYSSIAKELYGND